MFNGARILVAPLDWGLGHATRCVPIIHALIERGARPIIGADKGPLALLKQEFPSLEHVQLPGANVRYARGNDQRWSMVKQFPSMLRSIQNEQVRAEELHKTLKLDAM
ncbi:MAG TPA: glycosyltransferase, partial [Flavobacteriales bacterium]|nr:glycosyltransferase [Flavobacteriales bacterium]